LASDQLKSGPDRMAVCPYRRDVRSSEVEAFSGRLSPLPMRRALVSIPIDPCRVTGAASQLSGGVAPGYSIDPLRGSTQRGTGLRSRQNESGVATDSALLSVGFPPTHYNMWIYTARGVSW